MNLSSIQTTNGFFTLAAFDQRASLAKLFDLNMDVPQDATFLSQLKVLMMVAFSDICSGVHIDPEYGFPAITEKAKNVGLLMPLEIENAHLNSDPATVPMMIANWSVQHIKNNYAVASFALPYHPAETNAEMKKKLVIELGQYCRQEEVALVIEPIIFNPAGKDALPKTDFQEAQLITAQEFQQHCQLLKLEYPGDALSAATMTAELDIPWILSSRELSYDRFMDSLKVAIENGGKGFSVGQELWSEIGKLRTPKGKPDLDAIRDFLLSTGCERMQEWIKIL